MAALALAAAAVDTPEALDTGRLEFLFQIAGGVRELGEDDELLLFQNGVVLEEADQGAELVVLGGLDVGQQLQEFGKLVEVFKAVIENGVDIECVAAEFFNRVEDVLGKEILLLVLLGHVLLIGTVGPELLLVFADIAEQGVAAVLPAGEPGLVVVGFGVDLNPCENALEETPTGALEGLGGAFEALEEERADQDDDLFLAALVPFLVIGGSPCRLSSGPRDSRCLRRKGAAPC